jgi:putative ABC transport system permease protein
MRSFRFAWLSVVRQPARACLGILGVAAIGALLFDMLLLSRGLVVSFGELLDRSGFDVRVLATDAPPLTGPHLARASAVAQTIATLPEVESVLQLRVEAAEMLGVRSRFSEPQPQEPPAGPRDGGRSDNRDLIPIDFIGADPRVRSMWTLVEGEDLPEEPGARLALVVNQNLARRLTLPVGSTVSLRGRCHDGPDALPPVMFTVTGIADFPFDSTTARTVAGTLADADRLCGVAETDRAEMLLVRSAPRAGAFAAAAAIRALHPDLHVVTNEDLIERFSRVEFSYFRQISTVLATVTLFFGFLLIAVLLTVSVNQRLGEIAALRAVGLSRQRVTAGVLWESVLLVGGGGLLALPLGFGLSVWLDNILRGLPEVPAGLHFFVFEPRALVLYALLLTAAAIGAAIYPMRIVAALPIAATLRREVVS